MTTSDTLRTDAVLGNPDSLGLYKATWSDVVNLSRQLERENAALNAQVAELRKDAEMAEALLEDARAHAFNLLPGRKEHDAKDDVCEQIEHLARNLTVWASTCAKHLESKVCRSCLADAARKEKE